MCLSVSFSTRVSFLKVGFLFSEYFLSIVVGLVVSRSAIICLEILTSSSEMTYYVSNGTLIYSLTTV